MNNHDALAFGATLVLLTTMVGYTAASDEHNDPPEVQTHHDDSPDYENDSHIFHQPQWTTGLADKIETGGFPDRRDRGPAAGPAQPAFPAPNCITSAQLFPVEDTDGLFLTDFSTGAVLNFLYDAGEQLIAAHGDNYDFIAFWLNFEPHHTIGGAFYSGIANDVEGIGLPLFDNRPFSITNSERVMGLVMMWVINNPLWQPGDGPDADWVRLVLGQEFEHRYAMFLPPLLDGRRLQGDDLCARSSHWDFRVDGQGSSMEILDWIGQDPAVVEINNTFPLAFNTDIPGSIWSYTDLYLMGYVSPEEMDAGNSELRYLEDWPCDAPEHFGPLSSFDSSDIIASAGVRIPGAVSALAQKHYRTGWIMIHLPGDEPDQAELNKAAGILEQHVIDWNHSTLGRGTVDNTIFNDCNCNGVADSDDIAGGASLDINGNGLPDECEEDCNDNGEFDSDDIASGNSSDCNGNGVPDECDIAAGDASDCDNNGAIDDCQVIDTLELTSGELSPIGNGFSQAYTIVDPPHAVGDVIIAVAATADLAEPDQYLELHVNGMFAGRLFEATGSDCDAETSVDSVLLPPERFNVDVGDVIIKIIASGAVDAEHCDGTSTVTLDLEVPVTGANDTNGNGVPDTCECLADLDQSGDVGTGDLLTLLGAWGTDPGGPPDFDGDGVVNGADLIILLGAWGACP